jgi:hypothetical protein
MTGQYPARDIPNSHPATPYVADAEKRVPVLYHQATAHITKPHSGPFIRGKVGQEARWVLQRSGHSNNNSVALVRERNIPTEPHPLVDEVSANFCG